MAFFNSDTRTNNIHFIAKTPSRYANVGVGLLKDSTLMGTFPIPPLNVLPPLVASINMISTSIRKNPASSNPWIVPEPGDYLHYGDQMPLSPVESAYQAIQSTDPSTPSLGDLSPDPFHVIFPTDEMIMSVMSMEDTPWDDGHHHSILFLKQHTIENYQWISTPSTIVIISSVPESTHDVLYEGNLSNISPTIPLDISIKLSKMSTSKIHVPPMRLSHISHFFKNFVTSLRGATKICQLLNLLLLYMKLRPTQILNPYGRDFAYSTPI
jgi:hypothetical protein